MGRRRRSSAGEEESAVVVKASAVDLSLQIASQVDAERKRKKKSIS